MKNLLHEYIIELKPRPLPDVSYYSQPNYSQPMYTDHHPLYSR